MATAKRFSYSLLISTLAFAVFAAVAFSGLFSWIEAQFYSPKVVTEYQASLDKAAVLQDEWQKQAVEKLDKLLSDASFSGVFSPTASQADLQKRFQSAKLFLMGVQGGGSLRILNTDLSEIHFSSDDADVKARSDFSLTYKPASEAALPDLRARELRDGVTHLVADANRQYVYFLKPWNPGAEGYALLALSLDDLRQVWAEAGVPGARGALPLAAEEYLLPALGGRLDAAVLTRVQELRAKGLMPPVQALGRANGEVEASLIHKNRLSFVVPSSALGLSDVLKGIILVSFYTVLFLVSFLVANLRGEPMSLVTRKVKRFQLQVVKQYLDLKETDKIQTLREELAKHSDEIRSDVRKSLGRVRRRDQEWVDRYIDTSWQEVMDLLRGPSPPAEPSSNADWKRLETLLQQALTQGRFVVSAPPASAPAPAAPARRKPAADDVEELTDDVEELSDEVEELSDEVEELNDDVEELSDDVEELSEEVEELGEDVEELNDEVEELADEELAAEVEELEPEDAEPLDDVEELEEVEELEPAETGEGRLEELPPAATPAIYRLRSEQGGGVAVLTPEEEAVEELEEIEDLEVLEEVPEAEQAQDVSLPLERLDEAWAGAAGGVFEQTDDVVTISDEVFSTAETASDAFGNLVSEVLSGPDGEAFEPLHEDLVPQQRSRDWRWTGGGFDWDRFALGDDEVSLFRALSEAVGHFDAFTAAILTEIDGVWVGQSSVGFSDSGKESLRYDPESALSRQFLSIRALHALSGGSANPVLAASFHAKDLKFLRSMVCVPLLFRHEAAWLLLGLRHEPGDLLPLLAPRRFD